MGRQVRARKAADTSPPTVEPHNREGLSQPALFGVPVPIVLTECVINISEGRDVDVIRDIADQAEATLLDVNTDPEHHRSVLTLGGQTDSIEEAARSVISAAVRRIDLGDHQGVHPRMGVVDVVPFVPLGPTGRIDTAIDELRSFDWVPRSVRTKARAVEQSYTSVVRL